MKFHRLAPALVVGILTAPACSKDKVDDVVPTLPAPAPLPGDGDGDGDGDGSGDADIIKPLTLGVAAAASGDVVADESGLFSLTRTFSLTLAAESNLKVRKVLANGNCGSPNASFIFLKGEEQIADVTIDRNKDYVGAPTEVLPAALSAGDYLVVAFVTLEQECKSMMFYYDFAVEPAA